MMAIENSYKENRRNLKMMAKQFLTYVAEDSSISDMERSYYLKLGMETFSELARFYKDEGTLELVARLGAVKKESVSEGRVKKEMVKSKDYKESFGRKDRVLDSYNPKKIVRDRSVKKKAPEIKSRDDDYLLLENVQFDLSIDSRTLGDIIKMRGIVLEGSNGDSSRVSEEGYLEIRSYIEGLRK